MAEPIFREKSLKRITSPEELGDYLRVTSPTVWMVLAAGILLCNTGLLWLLTKKLLLNAFVSKLIVELLLFTASYLVQKRVIFRPKPLTTA